MTGEDIPALSEMYANTFNASPWNDSWTVDDAGKRLTQMLHSEDSYGLCAYDDGELCAMVLGGFEQFYDGVTYNLKELCVKNDLRGNGIGSDIMTELERRLRKLDAKDIVLFTARGEQTESFYRKNGFEEYGGMLIMGKQLREKPTAKED